MRDILIIGSLNMDTVVRAQHIPATGRNILRLPWVSRNSKHKGKGLSRTTAVKRLTALNPME